MTDECQEPTEYEYSNYHVKWLGKNYKLGDPTHRTVLDADLEDFATGEHLRAKEAIHSQSMRSARAICAFHGYGRNSVWPPVDPGRPTEELLEELRHANQLVQSEWSRLNELVVSKEREIQEIIINLTDGQVRDRNGEILCIQDCLEKSWEETRNAFNAQYTKSRSESRPVHMESDFSLDPEGLINPSHSSDLDEFAHEYLRNIRVNFHWINNGIPTIIEEKRQYPVYRSAANYRDNREAMEDAIMDDVKFRNSRKPDPELAADADASESAGYNFGVEDALRKQRAHFLVSHINKEDLSIPLNMLMFIHYRARLHPIDFAFQDNNRMHLGIQSHILSGACDPSFYVMFVPVNDHEPENPHQRAWCEPKIVSKHSLEMDEDRFEDLQSAGRIFGSMEAWLILQSQAITYIFLATFCRQMLDLAKHELITSHTNRLSKEEILKIEVPARRKIIMLKEEKGAETLQDIASIRQYEPNCTGLNLQRYRTKLKDKSAAAEEHIKNLFDDPAYLTKYIAEQKDHHWTNIIEDSTYLPNEYSRSYHDATLRHVLYRSCMRSVLRRAFFEFFIWEAITSALEDFETFEQETLKKPPKMEEFGYFRRTAAPRPYVSEELDSYTAKYLQIRELILHAAAFFIFTFRKEAVHAASEPMRNTYLTTKRPEYRQDWLIREYYDSEDIMLDFQETALHSDRGGKHRIVAELIENFISNKHSSMYVGIRKTTDKVKRHIEAHNRDAEPAEKFSNLISQTIDGLDLLADVAEHLELMPGMFRKSNEWTKESEKDTREMVSRMLQEFSSYDLLALDNCDFRDKHVPAKRTHRIFRFLDELQRFDVKEKEMSYGKAKGDIKRFGASLLKGLIYPLNEKNNGLIYRHKTWGLSINPKYGRGKVFPANGRALERLTKCMGITREQFTFAETETPLDLDAQGSNRTQKTSEEDRKITSEMWLALREVMTKRRQEQKRKLGTQKKRNKDKIRPLKPSEPYRVSKDSKGKAPVRTTGKPEEMEAGDDVEMEDAGFETSPMMDQTQPPNAPLDTFNARPPRVRPQSKYKRPPPTKPARRTEPVPDPTLAPDGLPKREINKHAWETLKSLTLRKWTYTNAHGKKVTEELPAVSLIDIESTFSGELGFRLEYGKGRHRKFIWTENCILPQSSVLKNFNFNPDKNATKGSDLIQETMKNWNLCLEDAGITWPFVKQWCIQKKEKKEKEEKQKKKEEEDKET
ncbi:uncharacterized protein FSUBG_9107 [Fusarium subglutinans]|uniref:Uncharacterized protein n=1 Tax=Gibberella subglutinans TaxID=42677 RepID=A0A8H5USE9_GIBSU|nr:uncharacterized protein FSUBG_9107 [Fusarium subglutinans]KAF5595595.1 hypothetical protein FSUBG_9107 [Fusarium subglutinans]